MLEKRWKAVPPQLFTADGTADGKITLASAAACRLFKVKQQIILKSSTIPSHDILEVKRITNDTTLYVGLKSKNIDSRHDISGYLVADGASIEAIEQHRSNVPFEEFTRAEYEEEPVVAKRVILVDECGDKYNTDNRFPVDATIVIPAIDVQLTDKDNFPAPGDVHDSVRIGDGTDELEINSDGSINVNVSPATTPTISNFLVITANTEYSYTLPTATKRFSMKDREGNAKLRVAYAVGDTAIRYSTVDMGCTYNVDGLVTLVGFTIYFQANKDNRTVEIVSWA